MQEFCNIIRSALKKRNIDMSSQHFRSSTLFVKLNKLWYFAGIMDIHSFSNVQQQFHTARILHVTPFGQLNTDCQTKTHKYCCFINSYFFPRSSEFIFLRKEPFIRTLLFSLWDRVRFIPWFKCALPAWPRFNPPFPVFIKRLAAAFLVFNDLLWLPSCFLILQADLHRIDPNR